MDGCADRPRTRRGAPQNSRRETVLRSRNERRAYYLFPLTPSIFTYVTTFRFFKLNTPSVSKHRHILTMSPSFKATSNESSVISFLASIMKYVRRSTKSFLLVNSVSTTSCYSCESGPISILIGWLNVPAYSAVMKATCRTSNRVFVGLPICESPFMPPQSGYLAPSVGQSPEFADVQTKFALQVVLRASLVNFFPKLIHP